MVYSTITGAVGQASVCLSLFFDRGGWFLGQAVDDRGPGVLPMVVEGAVGANRRRLDEARRRLDQGRFAEGTAEGGPGRIACRDERCASMISYSGTGGDFGRRLDIQGIKVKPYLISFGSVLKPKSHKYAITLIHSIVAFFEPPNHVRNILLILQVHKVSYAVC